MLGKQEALVRLRSLLDRIYASRSIMPNEVYTDLLTFERDLDAVERAAASDIDEYMANRYENYNKRRRAPRQPPVRVQGELLV